MLISIGAAVVTLTALKLSHDVAQESADHGFADPVRIISGVIGGLGFLGAGAIIQARGHVHGMTTAATIWVVGGIGVACGLAYYGIAITSALTSLLVLQPLRRFEHSKIAPEESVRKEESTPSDP